MAAPWIDNLTYPHIIDTIIQCAPTPVLKAFRLVSRAHRTLVDRLLACHLIIEGEFYSTSRRAKAVLHNSVWALVADSVVYAGWTEEQLPFGQVYNWEQTFPRIDRARVLDVHGNVRYTVMAGIGPHLPDLQTVRTYSRSQGVFDMAIVSDPKRTGFFGFWKGDDGPDCSTIPLSATQQVNFATLVPVQGFPSRLVNSYTSNVEELVVCVSYNPRSAVRPKWDATPSPPPSLQHATIIFLETSDLPDEYRHRDTDLPAFLDCLRDEVLEPFPVPVTIVGLERLASTAALPQSFDEATAAINSVCCDISYVALDDYRTSIDGETWDLYTREAPVAGKVDCVNLGNGRGTAVVKMMEWDHDRTWSRFAQRCSPCDFGGFNHDPYVDPADRILNPPLPSYAECNAPN